ncbi:MAG: strictosidine synthase family protein [Candidatus Binatia bacterium]
METATASAPPPRRRRWLRFTLFGLGLVLASVGGFTLRTLWRAGAFRSIEPHFAGRCRLIEGAVGSEDLTIDERSGRAYISSTDRRAAMAGRPVPGAIYAYDLDAPDAAPINLTPEAGVSFQPHGISLWPQPDGGAVLFVINHPAPSSGFPRHTVEIFDVGPTALTHRATLTDPRLVMPNDLVAVAADRFYLTNTHANPLGWRQTMETYLQMRGAQILSYGPGGFRVAAADQLFPNGINASRDGRTIYAASVTGLSLLVFDRDPATDALTLREEVPIGSGGDNIEVDGDGALWIGSHPKLLAVGPHTEDPANLAPAQVLRVAPGGAGGWTVDEIYLSEGKPLGAASVAARRGKRLLIGQIMGDGILDCEMED